MNNIEVNTFEMSDERPIVLIEAHRIYVFANFTLTIQDIHG